MGETHLELHPCTRIHIRQPDALYSAIDGNAGHGYADTGATVTEARVRVMRDRLELVALHWRIDRPTT